MEPNAAVGGRVGGGDGRAEGTRPQAPVWRALRILMALKDPPGDHYGNFPRGFCALDHFLSRFGHTVLHLHRDVSLAPWRWYPRLRSFRPDVVLTTNLFAAVQVAAFRRAGLIRCPVVHNWDDYYAEQCPLPARWVWPLEVLSVKWADHTTSVCEENLARARAWGVDHSWHPQGTHPESRPTSLRLASDRVRIVYLGDQSPYKNTRRLVESMREVPADLFMVGVPNPELQRLAPPNVRFTGPVPPDEVQAVLAQADILVNLSNLDSNFKWFEYMKAGKAILGIRGRPERQFENGRDALLVDDVAAGLRRLVADADLRNRLAACVSERRTYTWEEVARRVEAILLDVLERAGQGRRARPRGPPTSDRSSPP